MTAALLVALVAATPTADAGRPVAVFAELEGTWQGELAVFDPDGRPRYRIAVRRTYRTVGPGAQLVEVTARVGDRTIVSGRGRNVARRRADGSLELESAFEGPGGQRVERRGRTVTAADGGLALSWHGSGPGHSETVLETVRREGELTVHEIRGMGSYGEAQVLMPGRYVRMD